MRLAHQLLRDGDHTRQREDWPAVEGEVPKPRSISHALKQLAENEAQRNREDENGKATGEGGDR